jgi:cytochrome P450
MAAESGGPPVDLSALSFWSQTPRERDAAYARLRAEAPVSWQRPPEQVAIPHEPRAYWAVARYDDVRALSRDPERFCSGQGVMLDDVPPEILEASQSFLTMDDPAHKRLRGLVSAAFTPRRIAEIEDSIAADAARIIDELDTGGSGDFVAAVAKPLPLVTVMRMLGVGGADRERLVERADELVGASDPVTLGDRDPIAMVATAMFELSEAAREIAAKRRAKPADDLMSALVAAEIDGERLTDDEIAAFFVLLSVAGNDTTRHTSSHAMLALTENPDQRRALLSDPEERMPGAVEEFVRWATPVMTFRRTATVDTELRGARIAAGEKVILLYSSANRDERVFERPDRFEVDRAPNRHLGFGGGGPHYCLGASLARTQLRELFTTLLREFPGIEVRSPRQVVGNFVNGIAEMEMQTGPRR